jgi:hypothetical protein
VLSCEPKQKARISFEESGLCTGQLAEGLEACASPSRIQTVIKMLNAQPALHLARGEGGICAINALGTGLHGLMEFG